MRLLIIGNLEGQLSKASMIAQNKGAKIKSAPNIETALDFLRRGIGADTIVINIKDDIKFLCNALKSEHISIPVIACGFENDAESAANAVRCGAKDYLPLPPDEELIAEILGLVVTEEDELETLSPKMLETLKIADQVASSNATILITGESGTGKEVMSHYIHKKSARSNQNFVPVNCAAIPENLLESEFFGHEKGAFTGAIAKRIGKFEEANHGTLLLDEVSEIESHLQAKLLRALQEREIERVGGNQPIKLDVRVIATSNRDLKKEVELGNFRQDLFFRLNVININLPPLRERKEDILGLANMFATKFAKANGVLPKKLSPKAISALTSYNWPGNIRELENTILRAVLLANGEMIEPQDLMLPETTNMTENTPEKDMILSTLKHCAGDKLATANILGISIKILKNKLLAYEKEEA